MALDVIKYYNSTGTVIKDVSNYTNAICIDDSVVVTNDIMVVASVLLHFDIQSNGDQQLFPIMGGQTNGISNEFINHGISSIMDGMVATPNNLSFYQHGLKVLLPVTKRAMLIDPGISVSMGMLKYKSRMIDSYFTIAMLLINQIRESDPAMSLSKMRNKLIEVLESKSRGSDNWLPPANLPTALTTSSENMTTEHFSQRRRARVDRRQRDANGNEMW
jgi:hypothetical protein